MYELNDLTDTRIPLLSTVTVVLPIPAVQSEICPPLTSALVQDAAHSSSQDSLERLKVELETDLACVKAVVEEVVGDSEQAELAQLASLPAGSRHGVGRQLSQSPVMENKPLPSLSSRKVSSTSPGAESPAVKSPVTATESKISPLFEGTKSPVTITERSKSAVTGRDGAKSPVSLGARPRSVTKARQEESEAGVVLKQNSWTSRARRQDSLESNDSNNSTTSSSGGTNSFLRRKDLWERRSMNSPGEDRASPGWGSRTTPRVKTSNQTPDLVMDLPTGPLAGSPPIPAPRPVRRSPSSDSSSSSSSLEVPARNTTSADTFAADTDTMRKHSHKSSSGEKSSASAPDAGSTPVAVFRTNVLASTPGQVKSASLNKSLFSTPSSSSKPAVKVKPILHVKPSETKKDPPKDA